MNALLRSLATASLTWGLMVQAQDVPRFALDWVTVDNGAGTALGANYAVHLTLGQPDVGTARDGPFELHLGFWPGPWPPTSRPVLSATLANQELVLTWPAAAGPLVLERTPALGHAVVWEAVPATPVQVGNNLQLTLPRDPGSAFFRLRTPTPP